MSLTLNMVGGAGGAGLKDTDAVLVVTVPTGSTVTATKGGVTLTPTMWVTAAAPTLDCAIFSIKSSLFDAVNPWTVTATRGTSTASDTVIIDSNKQYDLELSYHVPPEYKEVEYLRATGTQYIDLGFAATGTSEFEVDFLIENPITEATGHGWVFGTRNSVSTANFGLSTFPVNRYDGVFVYGNGNNVSAVSHNPYIVPNQRMQASFRNSRFVTSTGADEAISQMSFTQSRNEVLFALRNEANSIEAYMKGNIYSIKFWSNSTTLIREMYPCYRRSDSVAGFWDKANSVFYTNAGTGTFVVGADV